MFVTKSRFNEMKSRAEYAEGRLYQVVRKHNNLVDKWDALVRRINKLGGEDFLLDAGISKPSPFTKDELQRLILLCHPDRHDGKPMANEMTAKLLKLKETIA